MWARLLFLVLALLRTDPTTWASLKQIAMSPFCFSRICKRGLCVLKHYKRVCTLVALPEFSLSMPVVCLAPGGGLEPYTYTE